ncbi:vWA domain-containing protein [Nocardioides marmoriginsengisoli]|nr:vWA domain-containing protein [Nocardioides marmoriginsengisoli]
MRNTRIRSALPALLVGGLLAAVTQVPASAAVPTPAGDEAVISVRTGGDRLSGGIGATAVSRLAGVKLALYADATAQDPIAEPWATCTSDAGGDCSFVVPDTDPGGANEDRRFVVRQLAAPAGWLVNPSLSTGGANSEGTARPYLFETGTELRAGATYLSQRDFMFAPQTTANMTNLGASSGIWQSSRVNPSVRSGCGLDVALILDLSSSVGEELPELKHAADALVDGLVGTNSRVATFSFSNGSPAPNGTPNHPALAPVETQTGADAVKAGYASWAVGGGTNWDAGMFAAGTASPQYDVAVVVTDGHPSVYGSPQQSFNSSWDRFKEMEYSIFSANLLKSQGTRVLAVGIGTLLTGDADALNLAAISGPTKYDGTNADAADYYQAASFGAAGDALATVAESFCAPKLHLEKRIARVQDVNDNGVNDAGDKIWWEFDLHNTGAVPLTDLQVKDPLLSGRSIPVTCPAGPLAVDARVTCAADEGYVITAEDVTAGQVHNVATATGEKPGGNPEDPTDDVPSGPSDTTTPVEETPVPGLALTKRVAEVRDVNGNGVNDAGDEIWWEFDLHNTGQTVLTAVRVDDPMLATIPVTCPTTTLAIDERTTCKADAGYVITAEDVTAGSVHNVATARGEKPGGNPEDPTDDVPSNPGETTTPVETPPVPGVRFDKRVSSIEDVDGDKLVDAGDKVYYEFTVTNTGQTTLRDVRVDDPLLTRARIAVLCPPGDLAAGQDRTCRSEVGYVITDADVAAGYVSNVATVVVTNPHVDGPKESGTDTVTVDTEVLPPASLPDTGMPTGLSLLIALALALVTGGGLVLWSSRRRTAQS